MRADSTLRLFWGGASSYSYPLHRDVSDGDVTCTMYSGCKDLVMLRPKSRKRLSRISIPGFQYMRAMTWSHDLFSDRPIDEVQGWRATLKAGEMLFMPGEVLHHIRNSCNQTVTLCRRPWRASFARDIFDDTVRTLNLMTEEDSLEDGLSKLRERRQRRG